MAGAGGLAAGVGGGRWGGRGGKESSREDVSKRKMLVRWRVREECTLGHADCDTGGNGSTYIM